MEVLRTAILQMFRQKKIGSFNPTEVIQQLYPEDWEQFFPELQEILIEMYQEGLITLEIDGKPANPNNLKLEKLKIRIAGKLI